MSSCDGRMPTGVTWCFEAWSESFMTRRDGAPSMWSTYRFSTLKEATRERDRLEKAWSKARWKKAWGERRGDNRYEGFEIYRVETTHVPRGRR